MVIVPTALFFIVREVSIIFEKRNRWGTSDLAMRFGWVLARNLTIISLCIFVLILCALGPSALTSDLEVLLDNTWAIHYIKFGAWGFFMLLAGTLAEMADSVRQ